MKLKLVIASLVAAFTLQFAPAQASGFCIPDLDGGCRYCEVRKNPFTIVCTG